MHTTTLPRPSAIQRETSAEGAIALAAGEILRLSGDRRGVGVDCRDGCVWITEEGEPGDTILHSGEQMIVSHRGLVLIEAMGAAVIRLF